MLLCEMCFTRLYRTKHHVHHNVEQTPTKHHFCSHECKMLWMEYVRETGRVPTVYVEIFKSDLELIQ